MSGLLGPASAPFFSLARSGFFTQCLMAGPGSDHKPHDITNQRWYWSYCMNDLTSISMVHPEDGSEVQLFGCNTSVRVPSLNRCFVDPPRESPPIRMAPHWDRCGSLSPSTFWSGTLNAGFGCSTFGSEVGMAVSATQSLASLDFVSCFSCLASPFVFTSS